MQAAPFLQLNCCYTREHKLGYNFLDIRLLSLLWLSLCTWWMVMQYLVSLGCLLLQVFSFLPSRGYLTIGVLIIITFLIIVTIVTFCKLPIGIISGELDPRFISRREVVEPKYLWRDQTSLSGRHRQELIKLPHIPVTVVSQTDLVLI